MWLGPHVPFLSCRPFNIYIQLSFKTIKCCKCAFNPLYNYVRRKKINKDMLYKLQHYIMKMWALRGIINKGFLLSDKHLPPLYV